MILDRCVFKYQVQTYSSHHTRSRGSEKVYCSFMNLSIVELPYAHAREVK